MIWVCDVSSRGVRRVCVSAAVLLCTFAYPPDALRGAVRGGGGDGQGTDHGGWGVGVGGVGGRDGGRRACSVKWFGVRGEVKWFGGYERDSAPSQSTEATNNNDYRINKPPDAPFPPPADATSPPLWFWEGEMGGASFSLALPVVAVAVAVAVEGEGVGEGAENWRMKDLRWGMYTCGGFLVLVLLWGVGGWGGMVGIR